MIWCSSMGHLFFVIIHHDLNRVEVGWSFAKWLINLLTFLLNSLRCLHIFIQSLGYHIMLPYITHFEAIQVTLQTDEVSCKNKTHGM